VKKFLIGLVSIIAIVVISGYGLFKFKNQPPEDLYAFYLSQDLTPVGKTGVLKIGLSTTEEFDPTWWYNIYQHVAHSRIPWPAVNAALADNGVALMDPDNFYAVEEFEPTRLVDRFGSERDMDAVPYIEKYRQGLVKWQPPRASVHLDTGDWLYTGRQDGIPTQAGKRINIAKYRYYGHGIKQRKIPAQYQTRRINEIAFGMLEEKYPDVPYYAADTMDPYQWHKKIYALLDRGVETLVLISPMTIYSDYEDFHNGFLHSIQIVREWEAENGRDIKVIIAPPMGYQKAMRDGYQLILKDKLDTLPAGADVKLVWSIHGMPWLAMPNESWLEIGPEYEDTMVAEAEAILESYDFGRTEVVVSQDHFADHYWDPDGLSLSTNKAFLDGVEDGYDYVLNIPIEFYNENTDTLFYHAMVNYENFPGYSIYDTIDYPDWDVPYTKHFVIEDTDIHYLGIPTGDRYRPYVGQAMFDSLDSILSRSTQLAAANQ
jgi:protoheme ferro-lyase